MTETGGWRNDHSFSSDAAVYGFENFIVPEVAQAHPTWNNDQVRHEARIVFMGRYAENFRFAKKEQRGEDTESVWREEVVDGERTLVVHGGAYEGYTLEQLWGNTGSFAQERGKAHLVDNAEYRAQKTMQQSLLSGEIESTAALIGHPDSVKIFQTFTRGEDGLYYARQFDLENAAGRTLTHDEGHTLMIELRKKYNDKAQGVEAGHDYFTFSNGHVHAKDVKMLARAIALTASNEPQPVRNHERSERPEEVNERMRDRRVDFAIQQREIVISAKKDAMHTAEELRLHPTRDALRTNSDAIVVKQQKQDLGARRSGESVVDQTRNAFKNKTPDSTVPTTDRLTIQRLRAKPEHPRKFIVWRHQEMGTQMAALAFVAETRVALGSAPVLLAILSKEPPKHIQAIEKSVLRHAKKEIRKAKKRTVPLEALRVLNATIRLKETKKKTHKELKRVKLNIEQVPRLQTREKKKKRKTMVFRASERLPFHTTEHRKINRKIEKNKTIRHLFELPAMLRRDGRILKPKSPELSVGLPRREQRWSKAEQKYVQAMHQVIRRLGRYIRESSPMFKSERQIQLQTKLATGKEISQREHKNSSELTARYSFAYALFALMEFFDRKKLYFKFSNHLQHKISTRPEYIVSTKIQKRIIKEQLHEEHSGLWLLASIIWYLAQIREQGFGTANSSTLLQQGVVSLGQSIVRIPLMFPTSGVIFTAYS